MFLGAWASDELARQRLREEFERSGVAVIDDFFDRRLAQRCRAEFPGEEDQGWHVYDNPLEIKRARDDVVAFPPSLKKAFLYLESPECLDLVRDVTGVSSLVVDPHRHGAGLHSHGRGGKLDVHVDYSVHPITGLTRSVNLLVYLTVDGWDAAAWGGDLLLSKGERRTEVTPLFNRAVLVRTDGPDEVWHGLPEPLRCPEGISRNSLAIYYVREGPPLHGRTRPKACFVPWLETQKRLARTRSDYANLFEIRSSRRLEPSDLWPGWKDDPDGDGIWRVSTTLSTT